MCGKSRKLEIHAKNTIKELQIMIFTMIKSRSNYAELRDFGTITYSPRPIGLKGAIYTQFSDEIQALNPPLGWLEQIDADFGL